MLKRVVFTVLYVKILPAYRWLPLVDLYDFSSIKSRETIETVLFNQLYLFNRSDP